MAKSSKHVLGFVGFANGADGFAENAHSVAKSSKRALGFAGFAHSVADSSKRALGFAGFAHSVADSSKPSRTVRKHSKPKFLSVETAIDKRLLITNAHANERA